jgi:PAS domain S-box-containing protein
MYVAKGSIRQGHSNSLFICILLVCGLIPFVTISLASKIPPTWKLNHEPFHAVLEILGCMMALGITAFLLMRQGEKGNEYKLWLACSMLTMAIIDAFHASAAPGREFIWLRATAQFIGGLLITLIWLPERLARKRTAQQLPKAFAAAAGLFGVISLVFPGILPTIISNGRFISVSEMLNLAGGVLFFTGVIYFAHRFCRKQDTTCLLFTAYCLMFAVSGVTYRLSGLWGAGWWLSHLVRLGAYVIAFGYVSASATAEYVRLTHAEEVVARLPAIVASSNDAIIGKALDGTIVSWNSGAERIYGYSAEEAKGRPGSVLVPPNRPDEETEILGKIKKGQRVDCFETVHKRKDGELIDVSLGISPINDPGGKIVGISIIARDITERKKMEEAQKQAKEQAEKSRTEIEQVNRQLKASVREANLMAREALAASKIKSEFLANMSHEIRTPMNAIVGFAEILSEETLTAEQKNYIDIIRKSGESLTELINDVLDFSKMEAGKLDIEIIDCSLQELLTYIESLMHPMAMQKGLEFKIIENRALPAQIRTDPARVRQCLINLTNNAIKFTEKGYVCINVSVQEDCDEPSIRFDVEDTGIGVPPEKQEVILEPFTQTDGSTSRKYGGTGLGLAITKQLANLLGGELSITSEVGKGSVFSLVIPAGVDIKSQPSLGRNNISEEMDIRQDKPEKAKFLGRVLVAEDSRTNQVLIKLLLERMGLQVTIAEDGQETIQKILAEEFDLIFMDIQMPNMNGYQATKALRKEGIRTPIVALTASAMKGDDKKCFEAGCDDYLTKPINRAELLKIIGKYLSSDAETLSEEIDSFNGKTEELRQFCSDEITAGAETKESVDISNNDRVIDWESFLRVCGDEDVVQDIVEIFLEDSPRSIEFIADAIRSENPAGVRLYAHRLKGSARHVAARQLWEKADCLEIAGRKNDIATAVTLFEEVRAEFEKVTSFLSQINWLETAKKQCNKLVKA